jgi:hypothetical protein
MTLHRSRLAAAFASTFALVALGAGPAEAKTFVLCPNSYGDTATRVKPRECSFRVAASSGARLAAANEVTVIKMTWSSWGGSTAKARGTYAGNMGVRQKGAVTLSRKKRCGSLGYVYTHFRMTFSNSRPFSFRMIGCV